MAPVFLSVANFITSVPEPISFPWNFPFNIGPPGTTIVGRLTLAAPITVEGVVLSQPVSKTTPSIGFPRIDSSASMLAKFLKSIAVGLSCVSPNDIIGNSNGNPPASYTPLFTDSAISLKCALQGVNSDQVLHIPITGRPSNEWLG